MNVAQVITLFLPDFVGGATLACDAVARGLRARGHAVRVFCGRPHGDAPPYAERTWDVDGLPVTGVNAAAGYDALAERAWRHPEVAVAFARFLARARPDVVHFHSIQALGADLLAVAAAHGVPIVLTMHDWWWWCARLFLVDPAGFVCPPRVTAARCHCAPGVDLAGRRAHLDAMLAHADVVLAPSRVLADAAIANGVDPARVAVCPNGIATARRRPAGRRRPGPLRFGYVGGPDHRLKGLPTLLAAADRMGCGGFELVLHVGTTAARHGLGRRLLDRVGTTVPIPLAVDDRVRLAPAFAPAARDEVLAGLDALVVPSLMRESFSLVTREALAAGVPVIASDSGGPLEVLVPERNGLVFTTGDADDLARCLRRFVLEPGLAERLAAGAAATPVPTMATQLDQLERIYADVLRAHARSPGNVETGTGPERVRTGPAASGADSIDAARPAPVAPAPHGRSALGTVLFLAGCDGPPYRYRVTHLRDALATRGVASRALWWTDPGVPDAIAAADVVVIHRVPMSPWLAACLAWARARGTPMVYSCDDLLFDPAATPHDALAALPENQRAWWLAATARYGAALDACDAFLAPTEPLAAAARARGRPALVARNGLGERALAVAERLRKSGAPDAGTIVLAYQSGTTMHDLDFAVAAPALARVLAARPHVRLRLGGHVRTDAALAPVADRIDRLPFLPWHEALAALAAATIQLAPLRLGDAFTDAKSEVKYLEAAALGLPTVASPTAAFRHAIRHGENGLLAATTAEWEAALLALIDDPGLRRRLGNRARDDVFLHATPAAQAWALVEAFTAVARAARTPAVGAAAAPCAIGGAPGARAGDAVVPPGRGGAVEAATPPDAAAFADETGRSDLEPDDLVPGAAVEARDTWSDALVTGRTIGQRFRASADGLCRIDVRLGGGAPREPRRIRARLAASPERREPVREAVVETAALAADAWVALAFRPIADSGDRDWYLWLEAEGAGPDGVRVWTYLTGHGDAPPGGLSRDHAPAPGSLTFRTFHAPAANAADAPPEDAPAARQ